MQARKSASWVPMLTLCPWWADRHGGGRETRGQWVAHPRHRAQGSRGGWRAVSAGMQRSACRPSGEVSPGPSRAVPPAGRAPGQVSTVKRLSGRSRVATWTGAPFPAKPRPLVHLTIYSPPGWPRPRPLICPGMPGCVLFSKHKPHPLWGRSSSYPQEALCLLGETDKERDGYSIHSQHHSHKDHLCSFSNIPGSL